MTTIDKLKKQISKAIEMKMKEDLTCEDILKLAQATSELERNDVFKTMTSLASSSFSEQK